MMVCPDSHLAPPHDKEGGVDKKAESCMLQAIEVVRPDKFGHIGDVGEWSSVSHWQWAKKKRPLLRNTLDELLVEAKYVNEGLDRIDAKLKKVKCEDKILIEGNHEVWVDNLCEENPHLITAGFSPEKLMKLKERGYKYHKYGEYVKLGKLYLYHGGHYTGVNHARSHCLNLSASVLYGHTHDSSVYKLQKLGGQHGAWSIGCISDMNKPFLRGRPTNWSHAFALVHLRKGGKFQVEIIDIVDGVCNVWGKKITA